MLVYGNSILLDVIASSSQASQSCLTHFMSRPRQTNRLSCFMEHFLCVCIGKVLLILNCLWMCTRAHLVVLQESLGKVFLCCLRTLEVHQCKVSPWFLVLFAWTTCAIGGYTLLTPLYTHKHYEALLTDNMKQYGMTHTHLILVFWCWAHRSM